MLTQIWTCNRCGAKSVQENVRPYTGIPSGWGMPSVTIQVNAESVTMTVNRNDVVICADCLKAFQAAVDMFMRNGGKL